MVSDLPAYGKPIFEWTEQDYRNTGMLRLAYISNSGHPYLRPCGGDHSPRLVNENGIIFIVCSWCGDAAALNNRPITWKRFNLGNEIL